MDNRFAVIFDNLGEKEVELVESMQYLASKLSLLMISINASREVSLALTNLEQSMMWAIKAVCLDHKPVSLADLHRNE
jgi:hypothetical protein